MNHYQENTAFSVSDVLKRAGFSLDNGTLSDSAGGEASDAFRKTQDALSVTPGDIRESGGLPQAISRKAAAVVRESFQGLDIHAFPPDVLGRWEYILSQTPRY